MRQEEEATELLVPFDTLPEGAAVPRDASTLWITFALGVYVREPARSDRLLLQLLLPPALTRCLHVS